MLKHTILLAAVVGLVLATPAYAAIITWDATVSTTTGDSDVISTGSINDAGADLGGTDGTSVVNGVTFTDAPYNTATTLSNGMTFDPGGWQFQWPSGGSTVGGDLEAVLDTVVFTQSNNPIIMNIDGLALGSQYTLQFFTVQADYQSFELSDDSGGPSSPAVTGEGELFIRGTFVANATDQSVTLTWLGPPDNFYVMNAFVIVPEPASLALMGLGCVGLLIRRRRRRV